MSWKDSLRAASELQVWMGVSKVRVWESRGRLGGQPGGHVVRSPTLCQGSLRCSSSLPGIPTRAQPRRLSIYVHWRQGCGREGGRAAGPPALTSHSSVPPAVDGAPLILIGLCTCVKLKHKSKVSVFREVVFVTNLEAGLSDCSSDVNRYIV